MTRPDISGYGMTLYEEADGRIRLSMQTRNPATADRAQHESLLHGPPIRDPDALPIHMDPTLLGSPANVRLGFAATDAPHALAEASGSDREISRRRWRSRGARLLGEALGTADRHRDEFLAVLSHELAARSPPSGMQSTSYAVRQRKPRRGSGRKRFSSGRSGA